MNRDSLYRLLQEIGIRATMKDAQIAQSDFANVHRKASPADYWRL